LPTSSPSSQELLLVLYQKQLQNNFSQANPLNQLLQFNLQANLLKLLGQDTTTTTNLSPNPAQLLSLSNYANQFMKTNKQTSKFSNTDLSNFLLTNKASHKNGHEAAHGDNKNQLTIKQEATGLGQFVDNTLKAITIPAFSDIPDQSRGYMNSGLDDRESVEGLSSKSKKIKKMNMCGHPERGHYAKNMCNPCYHKYGRTKKPWRCSHEKLYAHGLCQNCYINAYNKKRNDKVKEKKEVTSNFSGNELDTDLPTSIHSSDEPLTMEDKAAFGELEVQNEKINTENSQN